MPGAISRIYRRRAGVDIARSGGWGPDARLDRLDDLHDLLTFGDQGMHDIAGANLRRGLGRVAVDADVPAFAQLGRHRPGLDEANRAQPAINSCVVGHRCSQAASVVSGR